MSTAKLTEEQPIPEQYIEKMAKIRMAREAALTQDAAELLKANRRKVERMEAHLMNSQATDTDSGMIIIGDDVNLSYGANPQNRPPAADGPPNPAAGTGKLAKAALLAAAVATGGAGALGAAHLAGWLKGNKTENNTGFTLELIDTEKENANPRESE